MIEYPKSLYKSWADIDDTRVVNDAMEEDEARAAGYRMLSEPVEPAETAKSKK